MDVRAIVIFDSLYTAEEMRAAEQAYPGYPDSMHDLMERAGKAVAEQTLEWYSAARSVTVVCGSGSNGGDGRIAARALREAGMQVRVIESRPDDAGEDLGSPDVIVDALFGTGFSGAPRPPAARLIERMNDLGVPIVAVDVPSGVDASTGEVPGAAIAAALTVTFHAEKVGLRVTPGAFRAGTVEVVNIGIDAVETAHGLVTTEVVDLVPRRRPQDNKYTAGHVLVVGGSPGLTGAPSLVALAAMRADAGYVTVAAPRSTLPVLELRLLEAVKRPLAEDAEGRLTSEAADEILELATKASSVALGPGLGRSEGTHRLVERLLAELELPVVVDADALWELEPGNWPAPRVLTPHSGELARLLGESARWVDEHRLEAVRSAVERFGCIVLLKGAATIIAAPGQATLVSEGFAELATAGTGDVLTGIIGAFLAKGMDPRLATAAAARAHVEAAIEASRGAGLIASDVVEALPAALVR